MSAWIAFLWEWGGAAPSVSLNGVAFKLAGLRETVSAVSVIWDGWDETLNRVKKKVTVYGAITQLELAIIESETAWASSTYYTFMGYVGDDQEYALVINLGGEERVNTTVKVRDIGKVYNSPANAAPKYRRYNLSLQEV